MQKFALFQINILSIDIYKMLQFSDKKNYYK